jgi:hypothetical protein
MANNKVHEVELDSFKVYVFRSLIDGKLTVEVDSSSVADTDEFSNGTPKIRFFLNDEGRETTEDGSWVKVE